MSFLIIAAAVALTAAALGFIADRRFMQSVDTFVNTTIYRLDNCKQCQGYHVPGYHIDTEV